MQKTLPGLARSISHMLAALFNSRAAFHKQWQQYEAPVATADGIAGRWIGEWISEVSGHRGELKCVLTPASSAEYQACFHAAYSKLFRVSYATTLRAEESDGCVLLKGEEDLGTLAGGVYRCRGRATPTEFRCDYSCKYDRGIFLLKRLG